MLRLVQAIILVEDLEPARRRMESAGLAVEEGGRHPGRGTANLVIPLGGSYIELLAIVDGAEASTSPQGRPVLAAWAGRGPGLARWSVEVDDVGAAAARLGVAVERRERVRPDGAVIRWRAAGVDEAWPEPWRSAFMAWDEPALHPARLVRPHPNGATGFRLEVAVPDGADAVGWLGGPVPDGVSFVPFDGAGFVGPRRLQLETPAGLVDLAP